MSASSPKDKAPPSGDAVAAGLSTTIALAREKRGIVEEDGEDEAVARTLRCALSRASRVASQLRLLSALASTRRSRVISAGWRGHADVDVSPSPANCCRPSKCPYTPKGAGSTHHPEVIERLAKYLEETPSLMGKAAAPVVSRPSVYVLPRREKIVPATPADASDGSSCYARYGPRTRSGRSAHFWLSTVLGRLCGGLCRGF